MKAGWVDAAVSIDEIKAHALRDALATCPVPSATRLEEFGVCAQNNSGRCWMFAGLTVIRRQMMKNGMAEGDEMRRHEFELSQSFLVWYEKYEKLRAFLLDIVELEGGDNEELLKYLFRVGPVRDGSDWHVFRALVTKYGVVPKRLSEETFHTSNTRQMCAILNRAAVQMGFALRGLIQQHGKDSHIVSESVEAHLKNFQELLNAFLGKPIDTFNTGDVDMTPVEYYDKIVRPVYDLEQKIGLVSNPTLPVGEVLTVRHGKNSACVGHDNYRHGNHILAWVNVDMDTLQTAVKRSIEELQEAVWFGCDVDAPGDFDRTSGLQDLDVLARLDDLLSSKRLTRQQRIEYGLALSSHNMAFTGFGEGFFRVENSWGPTSGDHGYITMSDAWFREHVYGVVVDRSLCDQNHWFVRETEVSPLDPRLVVMDARDLFACI